MKTTNKLVHVACWDMVEPKRKFISRLVNNWAEKLDGRLEIVFVDEPRSINFIQFGFNRTRKHTYCNVNINGKRVASLQNIWDFDDIELVFVGALYKIEQAKDYKSGN